MVNRIFVVTLLVAAAFAAATTGAVWGSDPNKPVDTAQAVDVTNIVNPSLSPPPPPPPDTKAIAKSKAIPSVDETQKATRVIARGEKVGTMNVGTLNVDGINVRGGGRKVSGVGKADWRATGSGRLYVRPQTVVKKVGLGRKEWDQLNRKLITRDDWKRENGKFVKKDDWEREIGNFVTKDSLPETAGGDPTNLATLTDLKTVKDSVDEMGKIIKAIRTVAILGLIVAAISLAYSMLTGRSLKDALIRHDARPHPAETEGG